MQADKQGDLLLLDVWSGVFVICPWEYVLMDSMMESIGGCCWLIGDEPLMTLRGCRRDGPSSRVPRRAWTEM